MNISGNYVARRDMTSADALSICSTENGETSCKDWSQDSYAGDNWAGTDNLADAVSLASNGWSEAGAKLEPYIAAVSQRVQVGDISTVSDYAGDEVDIGRYLSGEPENMLNYQFSAGKATGSGSIELLVNIFVSAGVSEETIEQRGICLMSLIQALEASGLSVGVTMYFYQDKRRGEALELIRVKEPTQYLDQSVLAFWLMHPSSFRRIMFRVMEEGTAREREVRDVGSGYGSPRELPLDRVSGRFIHVGCLSYYEYSKFNTPEKCAAWVSEQLEKQGVSVEQ